MSTTTPVTSTSRMSKLVHDVGGMPANPYQYIKHLDSDGDLMVSNEEFIEGLDRLVKSPTGAYRIDALSRAANDKNEAVAAEKQSGQQLDGVAFGLFISCGGLLTVGMVAALVPALSTLMLPFAGLAGLMILGLIIAAVIAHPVHKTDEKAARMAEEILKEKFLR